MADSKEMEFVVLPKSQFLEISDKLDKMAMDLQEIKNKGNGSLDDALLTRKEAASLLHISLPTLWSYTKKQQLKATYLSGKVYYRRSDIEKALKQ